MSSAFLIIKEFYIETEVGEDSPLSFSSSPPAALASPILAFFLTVAVLYFVAFIVLEGLLFGDSEKFKVSLFAFVIVYLFYNPLGGDISSGY